MAFALTGGTAHAQTELLVEKTAYFNGNIEIEIVNRSDQGIDIYGVVVNRSSSPECRLAPVGSDYDQSLLRGDLFSDPSLVTFDDQHPLDAISLPFGGSVVAVSPRSCGRVLEILIETENSDIVYSWDR